MTQQQEVVAVRLVCKVFYDCGSERLGVESVAVCSLADVEETPERFIVHGLDGDAIWPRAKVVFYKVQREGGARK